MLEIAQNLESYAQNLSPEAQIAAGIIILFLGLFLWLGGIGYTKILNLAIGVLFGLACCILFTNHAPLKIAISAVVGGIIALILERAVITLITAALAAAFTFLILVQIQKISLETGLKTTLTELALSHWLIIAAPAGIAIIGGFYLWPLLRSLCSAWLGTVLIFAGMTLLLLFKGSAPVKRICEKPFFYGSVFIAMIAFGTILQLLLTPKLKKEQISPEQTENEKHQEKPD